MLVKPRPRSNQQAFNNVWRHFFIEGNKRGVTRTGMCAYRGAGTACAIGCQLPDKLYSEKLEGRGVNNLWGFRPKIREYFSAVDRQLLNDLQRAHDNGDFSNMSLGCPRIVRGNFKAAMLLIAGKYGLRIPRR